MPKPLAALLLASLLCRGMAAAQPSTSTANDEGWVKQASSLLLYDPEGSLINEIGLSNSDLAPATALEISGGVSPKGAQGRSRFAWVLERRTEWNPPRTKKLAVRHSFRFMGSTGKELWTSAEIEAPEIGEPVAFSADGEVLIAALRGAPVGPYVKTSSAAAKGWTAAIKSYIGNTLLEAGPFPRLREVALTPNGKYALIRWYDTDKSATHTFIEIASKKRQDLDSEKFIGRATRLSDDGKILAGDKVLFDFAASTSTRP